MKKLHELFQDFRDAIPELISTDIVNTESGLSIGGVTADPRTDGAAVSACYAEVVKANHRALELLGARQVTTEDILITTADLFVLIRLLGTEYCQVLAISRRGNLAIARSIMKRYERPFLTALGKS